MGDNDFGEAARQARVKKRMTLRQVAERLGFSIVYISDMERGAKRPPTLEKTHEWAAAIGADLRDFVALAEAARDRIDVPRSEVSLELARMRGVPTQQQQDQVIDILRNRQRPEKGTV